MPYATNGQISQSPIEGGIEITQQQYQEALAGILEGKLVTIDGGFAVIDPPQPEPEPEPEPEPQPVLVVSRFQALAALMQAGLLDAVQGWINDPQTDPLTKLAFDAASEFHRDSAAVAAGAAALGWTEQQLDALFDAAAQIQA